ncbi:hypothetical protein J2Z48_002015 [Croceifilum oryzae]|uniref:Glycosyl transferase n=1 Tax=Croceifilum oryzae TaxID=1553429 RepID=A0AAJ1TKS7_9BACL|nr:glycoside hydrolase family 99-like domain-containing protein [Croceifilum oryzae]MDQ0417831.1 hypothetical protein [Croceifilum oryzae]
MKLIAFYLPQFHEIPENDKWWGKGFTDWVNTRESVARFPGHYQPREPYQDNYYDLAGEPPREWQAQIAKEYGIYGFCYYHYWFKGKRILHKPLDAILQSGKPDLPFCLSWANDPWTRSWEGSDEVLEAQDYGEEWDWREHFEFLLPVFKDERYIRVDNKPIFLIYRPSDIPRCTEMLQYWQSLARENGLDGIHLIQTLNRFYNPEIEGFEARVEFEPGYTMNLTHAHGCHEYVEGYQKPYFLINYDLYWKYIVDRKASNDPIKTYLGAFADWDNSARAKGEEDPLIFSSVSPEKFATYLDQQIKKSIEMGSELLFINAWNEWAEGAYLEPDKKYEFQYLEAVRKAVDHNL